MLLDQGFIFLTTRLPFLVKDEHLGSCYMGLAHRSTPHPHQRPWAASLTRRLLSRASLRPSMYSTQNTCKGTNPCTCKHKHTPTYDCIWYGGWGRPTQTGIEAGTQAIVKALESLEVPSYEVVPWPLQMGALCRG